MVAKALRSPAGFFEEDTANVKNIFESMCQELLTTVLDRNSNSIIWIQKLGKEIA